jgi:hypothetical protein
MEGSAVNSPIHNNLNENDEVIFAGGNGLTDPPEYMFCCTIPFFKSYY